uniref:Uncharacterized protein n=1 Tax=Arundo donax TaxID=35708 RepID=A0A0A9BE25_ARUDO
MAKHPEVGGVATPRTEQEPAAAAGMARPPRAAGTDREGPGIWAGKGKGGRSVEWSGVGWESADA